MVRSPGAKVRDEYVYDGAAIPGLEIVGELGRGEQAVVYRARRGDGEFALKLLRPTDEHSRAAVAFRREAGLVACVNHPGVAYVHEVGDVDGRPYLVMDLVEGDSLGKLIASGRQDQRRVVALAIDVADALAAAHRVGVVHRDVKPQNIVVAWDGRARLIDFGLAATPGGQLAADTVAGTVAYAAPEQTGMLKRPVDGRADLYALGVVMFECVTGVRPFTAEDPAELIRLHGTTPAPDVRLLRPDVAPVLADVIAKLLAKDPDDRYQTGEGLLADLRRIGPGTDGESFPLGEDDAVAGRLRTPLAGRQRELGRLSELWRRVCAGRGAVAVVDGPVGIGKTRLVEELLDAAEAGGAVALRATCAAGDPVPMSALRGAVEQYLCGAERLDPQRRSALATWLSEAAGTAEPLLGPLSPTLARLLHLRWSADERSEDQFGTAVAAFLVGLARASGGLVLHLDRAEALDPASQRLVRQLVAELPEAPILLVCTGTTEATGAPVGEVTDRWSPRGDGIAVDLHLSLEPLADADIAMLAQAQLGGAVLSDALQRQLTARVRGNPSILLDYLRAMIESGAAYPSWGSWALDRVALDGLDLSSDACDLLRRRIDRLAPSTREVLTVAAAVPVPFTTGMLAEICEMDRSRVALALEEAISHGILAGGPNAMHVFLHDLFTEALLAGLAEDERQALHYRVIRALESIGLTGSAVSYAIARQYAVGDPDRDPAGMFAACYRAGRLALAEDAAPEAANLLALAGGAAERAGIVPDGQFYRTAGLAAARIGRFDEARGLLLDALARESDPMHRAEIQVLVAHTYQGDHAAGECVEAARAGLAELGKPLPRNPLLLVLSTVVAAIAGIRVGLSRPGRLFGTAEGETLQRYRLRLKLYEAGAVGAAMAMRPALAFAFRLHSMFPANRVGSVPEYVRLRAAFGALCHTFGANRSSRRLYRSSHRLATMHSDPSLVAHVAQVRATAEDLAGGVDGRSGRAVQQMLERHGRWLELTEYLAAVAALGTVLALRGYAKEALGWYERGRTRLAASARVLETPFAMVRPLALAALGRTSEAVTELDAAAERIAVGPGRADRTAGLLLATLRCAVEGDLQRVPVDPGLPPRKVWSPYRFLWVYQAFDQLAQVRAAGEGAGGEHVARADRAVRQLRRAANSAVLRAHYHCAQASLLQLTGRSEPALAHLARADQLAHRRDLPWLACEIATVRARVLAAIGAGNESLRHAKIAYLLAAEQGWVQRSRAIRVEFDAATTSIITSDATRVNDSAGHTYQRRLAALQQVSAAAATVLDPRELARVALDEIIRILGAERALLFLADEHAEHADSLRPHLGRDAAGNDLDDLTGYGSTLVERVRRSGEPLVVAGSEQGVALGSESVVLHGLRSIMVAPLQLKGRLLGVVYLDNRVAKGVFTVGDVDILTAITHLIAGSLETARTAQLERDIHAAQQQRDLAELMRSAVTEVSDTLDPDEVLSRLAGSLTTVLSSDRAYLLRPSAAGVSVSVLPIRAGAVDCVPDPSLMPSVTGLMGADAPVVGGADTLPPAFVGLLPEVQCWMSIPLVARDERVGLLFVASTTMTCYEEAQVNIAAAMAGQTMIAYDNALLFSRVEQLATTDALTGISNRRHFFELAGRQVQVAARGARPLAGVMLDIDHFKRINDTYGHGVGDEVIRTVANRLASSLRGADILGRYGGEEFAIVVPEVADEIATIAERIRASVAATPVDTAAGPVPVTISVGVACLAGGADDLDALLARADAALYKAKQSGRNQVVVD